jgi:hypothetical protein
MNLAYGKQTIAFESYKLQGLFSPTTENMSFIKVFKNEIVNLVLGEQSLEIKVSLASSDMSSKTRTTSFLKYNYPGIKNVLQGLDVFCMQANCLYLYHMLAERLKSPLQILMSESMVADEIKLYFFIEKHECKVLISCSALVGSTAQSVLNGKALPEKSGGVIGQKMRRVSKGLFQDGRIR